MKLLNNIFANKSVTPLIGKRNKPIKNNRKRTRSRKMQIIDFGYTSKVIHHG